ncbi:MAG: DEAD/DEAH box helicase family protein [Treponema sp.]|nr:DEAD/DEAH box helicase family protein [Treponema sp.]
MTPEQKSRIVIDKKLRASGWVLQDKKEFNPTAAAGAGKTYTAITAVYRLLKYVKVKRVLFLVDTRNLGLQAETEFIGYTPNDETRRFSESRPRLQKKGQR